VKIIKPSFARIKTLFARPLTRFIEENRTNEKKKTFPLVFRTRENLGKGKKAFAGNLKKLKCNLFGWQLRILKTQK
jgi:hypothetical protein